MRTVYASRTAETGLRNNAPAASSPSQQAAAPGSGADGDFGKKVVNPTRSARRDQVVRPKSIACKKARVDALHKVRGGPKAALFSSGGMTEDSAP
jgi:hypothetical protein